MPKKERSRLLTEGVERAPHRAMLRAIGFTDEDLNKPLVGIANTWAEINTCNYHLRELAEHVKRGVSGMREAFPLNSMSLQRTMRWGWDISG